MIDTARHLCGAKEHVVEVYAACACVNEAHGSSAPHTEPHQVRDKVSPPRARRASPVQCPIPSASVARCAQTACVALCTPACINSQPSAVAALAEERRAIGRPGYVRRGGIDEPRAVALRSLPAGLIAREVGDAGWPSIAQARNAAEGAPLQLRLVSNLPPPRWKIGQGVHQGNRGSSNAREDKIAKGFRRR
jgi:hypothetical protein